MIGKSIGPYQILAELGRGGMGEVYRARDTRLNRDVALKILPEAFAADLDRLARFTREAQTLAALNHPNIAQIYGFEDASTTQALVMELVDGKDLSAIIAGGAPGLQPRGTSAGPKGPALQISDALAIARQIADALEAAHENGIVHRDLKPANIKVKDDGTVKVLDFGLAKTIDADASGAAKATPYVASNSPTVTTPAMTQMGLILGTAAYMSPEQAKGRPVDKRSDIWAFGVVLYEMLTGRRLFDAEDVSETLAAVLTRDVGGATLPQELPVRLRALIGDCLVRNPKQRLRDIGDARIVLEKILAGAPDDNAAADATTAPRPRWRALVWPAVALVGLATAAAFATMSYLRPAPAVPDLVQFSVAPPDDVIIRAHRLSPDGHMLALGASAGSKAVILMHTFETATTRAVPTEGISSGLFAWSPDSKAFLFTTEGRLRKASADGGPSQIIATLPENRAYSASWGSRDVILLGPTGGSGGPLFRVAAAGGDLVPATELASNERTHNQPHFLPNGRDFFFRAARLEPNLDRVVYVGSLDSKERRPLPGITSEVLYSSGRIFFVREGSVMSQPFDPERLELSGTASLVVDAIAQPTAGTGRYSVSLNGTLAYSALPVSTSQLVWFDRAGKLLEPAGPTASYSDIELSVDERYVAFESGRPGDIWVLDLRNGVTQRVTSHAGHDANPVWSPDGKTIAFQSDREGGGLYSRAFGVVGEDQLMHKSESRDSPASWSLDGRHLTFEAQGAIWALPLTGDRKPFRITDTTTGISRSASQISPDGRWVAYESNELGQSDVFIQSFPQSGAKQRVSSAGGRAPRWSRDGQELFYQAPDDMLMTVVVKTTGGSLNVGTAAALFKASAIGGSAGAYAVSSTGRFLMNVPGKEAEEASVTVILNWAQGIKR